LPAGSLRFVLIKRCAAPLGSDFPMNWNCVGTGLTWDRCTDRRRWCPD